MKLRLTENQAKKLIDILNFHSNLFGSEHDDCKQLIEIIEGKEHPTNPYQEMENIIEDVSEVTGVSIGDIKSKSRKRHIVMARSYAIYQIIEQLYHTSYRFTLQSVADKFRQDHATTYQAHKRIAQWIEDNDPLTMPMHNAYKELISKQPDSKSLLVA